MTNLLKKNDELIKPVKTETEVITNEYEPIEAEPNDEFITNESVHDKHNEAEKMTNLSNLSPTKLGWLVMYVVKY